jgi:putative toxin-antitoxin system antitoxin component (TIGR02293 family)
MTYWRFDVVALEAYTSPETLPGTVSGRVGMLLGLKHSAPIDDIGLAERVANGLRVTSAEALGAVLGRASVVGPMIPEATLRRAKKGRKALSREMSERLYEVGRVVDAVSRTYQGDKDAISRFLNHPHKLLGGNTPLQMARSSSAGAEAVINMLRRADSGFSV